MQLKPGVKLISESEGLGDPIRKGDRVRVFLAGWLTGGDPIQERSESEVLVGGRILIPGIEYAIEGMRVGGIRRVKISPHLAYKENGVVGVIPPNAVLTYEIEVVAKVAGT